MITFTSWPYHPPPFTWLMTKDQITSTWISLCSEPSPVSPLTPWSPSSFSEDIGHLTHPLSLQRRSLSWKSSYNTDISDIIFLNSFLYSNSSNPFSTKKERVRATPHSSNPIHSRAFFHVEGKTTPSLFGTLAPAPLHFTCGGHERNWLHKRTKEKSVNEIGGERKKEHHTLETGKKIRSSTKNPHIQHHIPHPTSQHPPPPPLLRFYKEGKSDMATSTVMILGAWRMRRKGEGRTQTLLGCWLLVRYTDYGIRTTALRRIGCWCFSRVAFFCTEIGRLIYL